jgi:hypothetical protein
MTKDEMFDILLEFFYDSYHIHDRNGVGDWMAQGGQEHLIPEILQAYEKRKKKV